MKNQIPTGLKPNKNMSIHTLAILCVILRVNLKKVAACRC